MHGNSNVKKKDNRNFLSTLKSIIFGMASVFVLNEEENPVLYNTRMGYMCYGEHPSKYVLMTQ